MSDEPALVVSYLPSAKPDIAQLEDDDIIVSFQGVQILTWGYAKSIMPIPQKFERKQPCGGLRHAGILYSSRYKTYKYTFGVVNKHMNPENPVAAHGYVDADSYQSFLRNPESMYAHPRYFMNSYTPATRQLAPISIWD